VVRGHPPRNRATGVRRRHGDPEALAAARPRGHGTARRYERAGNPSRYDDAPGPPPWRLHVRSLPLPHAPAHRKRTWNEEAEHGRSTPFPSVHTLWYNPAQESQAHESVLNNGNGGLLPASTGALTGPPVRYRNRELANSRTGASIAGWYYIAIYAARDLSDEPTPVPVTVESPSAETRSPHPATWTAPA
jgi:hypothetical protein